MASIIEINIVGDARKYKNAVGQAEGATSKLTKSILGAGAITATAFAGAGVALFAIGNQFDQQKNIIIEGTGATGAALESLIQQSKDVLATVPESGEIVSGAIADVNTFFGQTGDQLEGSTRSFLEFARVTKVDVGDAIGATDAILTQFGETGANLDEVLGDLTRVSQATGAPMSQLLSQLETFGPTFANAGFSVEETASIFGQLEQAGVNVTRIGPALNKFFRDTAANGEDPRVALEGMVTAIADAETSADALNLATDAFGSEGAQRLSNAIRSGNFDLEDYNGLLGEGAGLVGEQAAATETFSQKLSTFKNQILVALAPAAEVVFTAVGDAIDDLQPYIDKFGVWFAEQLPIWIENLQAFFKKWGPIVIGAVKAVVDFISDNWPTISEIINTAVDVITTAFNDFLIPAAEYLLEAFEFVRAWVEENWPTISEVITTVIDTISGVITFFVDQVTLIWSLFGDDIISTIEIAWTFVQEFISGAFDIITGVYNVFKGLFTGDWSLLWNGVTSIFTGAWSIAQASITAAFDLLAVGLGIILDGIKAAITGTWDSVVTEVSGLGSRIATAAVGIFDGIKDAFKAAINFVINAWNNLSFTLPSIDLGLFGTSPSFTISTPDIPQLATGGALFAPRLVVLGDNPGAGTGDPEIAAPQSFIAAAVTDGIRNAGGGGTTINVQSQFVDSAAFTKAALDSVRHTEARNGSRFLAPSAVGAG